MVVALLAIGVEGLSDVLDEQPANGIPFVLAILLGALVTYLILAFGSRVWGKKVSL
tara:strand:+ start:213 stop:380 length:168 start_codon:yes stop_codon:yes gene_type:complete